MLRILSIISDLIGILCLKKKEENFKDIVYK